MEEVGVVGGRLSALDLNIGRFGSTNPPNWTLDQKTFLTSHIKIYLIMLQAISRWDWMVSGWGEI